MPTLPNRLRQAAQYTGLDSMRELLIEAAGALEQLKADFDSAVAQRGAAFRRIEELERGGFNDAARPVVWMNAFWLKNGISADEAFASCQVDGWIPLYTAPQPQERKPLTDAEIVEAWRYAPDDRNEIKAAILFARSIEAAHGIKE